MRLSTYDNAHGVVALSFVGATLAGWTIQEWAALAALIYTLVLLGEKLFRFWRNWKQRDSV